MKMLEVLYGLTKESALFAGYDPKADMSLAWDKPPAQARAHLEKRGKKLKTSLDWDSMDAVAHSKSFTVAGVMKADILEDIYNMVDRAQKEGLSFHSFKKGMENKLADKGWWGEKMVVDKKTGKEKKVDISQPSRLKTIYNTNLQTAYGRGRYEQQKSASKYIPYVQYLQRDRKTRRPKHEDLDGLVFRFDDPVVVRIYPPRGHNCGCQFRGLSEKDLKREGLEVTKGDKLKIEQDEGWDYDITETWTPDTSKYQPTIKKAVDKELKKTPPMPEPKAPVDKTIKEQANEATTQTIADVKKRYKQIFDESEKIYGRTFFDDKHKKKFEDYYNSIDDKTSSALDDYKSGDYAEINKSMRDGEETSKYSKTAKQILNDDMDYKVGDIPKLYRGESTTKFSELSRLMNLKANDRFDCGGQFNSTSLNPATAVNFGMMRNEGVHSVVYEIDMPDKFKAGAGMSWEQEFILHPDATYEIISTEVIKVELAGVGESYKIFIKMKYIEP